eukprot:scpid64814/ scgid32679/ Vacuolar protein sorting-associated protein 37B; ESCRT-I complex subunit VPS37B
MADMYRRPPIPESFPMLETIPNDDLENMIDTDDKFGDFFSKLSQVQVMTGDINALRVMNQTAAEATLQRQTELEEARDRLADTYATLLSVRSTHQDCCDRLERCSRNVSTEAWCNLRDVRCSEQEAEAQSTADAFLDGNLPVDEFLTDFLAQRQRAIVSRVHTDKMKTLLSQQEHSQQPSVAGPLPTSQQRGATLPYPGSSGTSIGAGTGASLPRQRQSQQDAQRWSSSAMYYPNT